MGIVPPCVGWVNQSAGINQERRHPEMSRRTGQAALGSNGTKEGRRWTPKLKENAVWGHWGLQRAELASALLGST